MILSGTLRTWHDDRGFGFIAPSHGGAELFVHITALPNDGTRPTVGERLSYELGRGKDGRPQAVNVSRDATRIAPRKHVVYALKKSRNTSFGVKIIGLLMVLALGAYGYKQYGHRAAQYQAVTESKSSTPAKITGQDTESTTFRCDGRTHCSQMTSCTEAKLFLKNCPGMQMDGNNDGVPCEQQWCTGLFSK